MVDIKFSRRHAIQAWCLDQSRHRFHHFRELQLAIPIETLGHTDPPISCGPNKGNASLGIYCENNRTNRACLLSRLVLELTRSVRRLLASAFANYPCVRTRNVTDEIGCRSLPMEAKKAQAEQQTETYVLMTDQSARILERAATEANAAAPSPVSEEPPSHKSNTKDFDPSPRPAAG